MTVACTPVATTVAVSVALFALSLFCFSTLLTNLIELQEYDCIRALLNYEASFSIDEYIQLNQLKDGKVVKRITKVESLVQSYKLTIDSRMYYKTPDSVQIPRSLDMSDSDPRHAILIGPSEYTHRRPPLLSNP